MSKKKKRTGSKKKVRTEYIYGTTKGDVSELILTTNSKTGEISFENDMVNVYSEVTYDRPDKGPKVLSRIPQKDEDLSFQPEKKLPEMFDFLCAVDTNTKNIRGKNVSVVGVVTFQSVWVPEKNGMELFWQTNVPFCLEYINIKTKPENFGWIAAIQHLEQFDYLKEENRIGMVVDSDLGKINDYNQRKKPIYGPDYLPERFQLIYASTDVGKENIVNKLICSADSVSKQCLKAVFSGILPFNEKPTKSEWFEGFRILRPDLHPIKK